MLKKSGSDSGWDDGMKFFEYCILWAAIMAFVIIGLNDLVKLQEEKTALEIKVLQHELKAYEEMDRELAE